ncbi:hypothetical protein RJT34_18814 [Clitoria ternatea]|uniref:Uncharacterized protein n=1 Tax=Clitoria ternatea TaxID=43366 RepID=A0AAN9IPW0_CLITE
MIKQKHDDSQLCLLDTWLCLFGVNAIASLIMILRMHSNRCFFICGPFLVGKLFDDGKFMVSLFAAEINLLLLW